MSTHGPTIALLRQVGQHDLADNLVRVLLTEGEMAPADLTEDQLAEAIRTSNANRFPRVVGIGGPALLAQAGPSSEEGE